MKYIVVKSNGLSVPVIFGDLLRHKDVFEALKNYNVIGGDESPVSAGLVSIVPLILNENGDTEFEVRASGESLSLNVSSRPEDSALIKRQLDIYSDF